MSETHATTPSGKLNDTAQQCLDMLATKKNIAEMANFSEADLEAMYKNGYDAWESGDLQSAADSFAMLTMLKPEDYRFAFAFGCVLKYSHQYLYALSLFKQALLLEPEYPFITFHIAECMLALKEIEAARDALDTTIELCFNHTDHLEYASLREKAYNLLQKLNH